MTEPSPSHPQRAKKPSALSGSRVWNRLPCLAPVGTDLKNRLCIHLWPQVLRTQVEQRLGSITTTHDAQASCRQAWKRPHPA